MSSRGDELEAIIVTEVSPPTDSPELAIHPVIVYLSTLSSKQSRRTMREALDTIAKIVTNGQGDALTLDWAALRYRHTAAIRAILVERYAPATVNKMLCALRRTLKEAWRLELMSLNDYSRATDISSVKGSRKLRGRMLNEAEISALLEACALDESVAGVRDAAMLYILMAGLRRDEVVSLDLKDFDPKTGTLQVRCGKGGDERTTYLVGDAIVAVNRWIEARGNEPGPLSYPMTKGKRLVAKRMEPQTVRTMLRKRAEETGVEYFSPHDLRYTFISLLLEKGVDILTVQKLSGHKSPVTTARYDRRGELAKIRAIELISLPYPKVISSSTSQGEIVSNEPLPQPGKGDNAPKGRR